MKSAFLRLLTCLIILLAITCAPAAALTLSGQVLDQKGQPVAGAIISDEVGLTLSGKDGGFRLESQPGRVVSMSAPRRYQAQGQWWLPTDQVKGKLVFKVKRIKRMRRTISLAIISDPHLYSTACPRTFNKPPKPDPALPMLVWRSTAKLVSQQGPDLVICPGDMCMDADRAAAWSTPSASSAWSSRPWPCCPPTGGGCRATMTCAMKTARWTPAFGGNTSARPGRCISWAPWYSYSWTTPAWAIPPAASRASSPACRPRQWPGCNGC